MSWIGSLFGTSKAVDAIVDKDKGLLVRAGTALGNLHYSDQEKSQTDERTREWGIRVLDAIAPFKVVQRILAFSAMGMWIFIGVNLSVAIWIKAVYPEIDAVTSFTQLAFSDYIFWPVIAIFTLYTGGGTINSLKGAK
jgi:hypothetical protein